MNMTNQDLSTDKPAPSRPKRGVPEGLWRRCPECGETIYGKEADQQLGTYPQCDHHFYVTAIERIGQVLDGGTFEELFCDMAAADPLNFADKKAYRDRLKAEQKRTGLTEAAVVGTGMIRARRVAFGVTDSAFIMGSMGAVVGGWVWMAARQRAVGRRLRLTGVGARMGGGGGREEG